MKIAIHKSSRDGYFCDRWITYCEEKKISYKIVNCYDSDIIDQLSNCDALMWHFSHADAKDFLFAKQLIKAVEEMGLIVLPNYNSCWHFDDKVAQKYLFEALSVPTPKSRVFYEKEVALDWAKRTSYPKVFKLRGGAGSGNVSLIKSAAHAQQLIKRAFSYGFRQFNRSTEVKDVYIKFKAGKINVWKLSRAFGKLFICSAYERIRGKEKGYIYFQDYIPNNTFDIRIIVIGDRAFGIKRLTRKNDFRASGSGQILFKKEEIDERCVEIAFDFSRKLKTNCLTYDFVFDENNNPLVVEISFGFVQEPYYNCEGYWDKELNWVPGKFIQQEWMVDLVFEQVKNKLIQ